MVKTFEHSQAPSTRTSHTRLIKAWAKNGKRSGSDSRMWSDANGAPPVYRVDLTRPVVNAEHGKAVSVHPALAVPRQAGRKAGPGETAWRGSNKPRPIRNGRIRPRRSGLSLSENRWNRSYLEKQMTIDACRLVRLRPGIRIAEQLGR